MQTITKSFPILTLIFLFIIIGTTVNAQRGVKPRPAHHPHAKQGMHAEKKQKQISMVQAQKVLKRTHYVIVKARQALNENKNYTGDLAKAVAYQKQAKKMFAMKNPHRSIQHSREARKYAFRTLEANNGSKLVDKIYQFNSEETGLAGIEDKSLNLEKELQQTTFDDEAITDKEMTELEVLDTDLKNYKNE